MSTNIMDEYVKNTRTFISNFTKMFFAENYNKEISEEYINAYIDSRIYNYGDEEQRFFYRRIYESLVNKKNEIAKKNKKIEEKILEDNLEIYQFIFYLDGVRPIENLSEYVKQIYQERKSKFELNPITGLEGRILKESKKHIEQKEQILKKYETDDFSLKIEKYTLIDNTYKVNLDFSFRIPYIYSNAVIKEVYNTGVVNEDKHIIEYTLLTLICIRDINKGNFATKYLVNFADTLYTKQNKLKQTLRIIDNPAIQDKVFLKIKYKEFAENKDTIYDLMKDGFRFAIVIDEEFNPTDVNLKKMSVFKYLLVTPDVKSYEKIKQKENKISNIVIYDV